MTRAFTFVPCMSALISLAHAYLRSLPTVPHADRLQSCLSWLSCVQITTFENIMKLLSTGSTSESDSKAQDVNNRGNGTSRFRNIFRLLTFRWFSRRTTSSYPSPPAITGSTSRACVATRPSAETHQVLTVRAILSQVRCSETS